MADEKIICEEISHGGDEKFTENVGNIEQESKIDRENNSNDYEDLENSSQSEMLKDNENGENTSDDHKDLENNRRSKILEEPEKNSEEVNEKSKMKGANVSQDHSGQINNCHSEILKEEDCERKKEITLEKEEESDSISCRKFTIAHDEETTDDEIPTDSTVEVSSIKLLRGTICELERALQDSRSLLKKRDEEIVNLRKEIEKGREQVHKEQMKWQRKCTVVEERNKEIYELKRKLNDSEKANEELQERIKEFESPFSESDDVFACCSSMKELVELKTELAKKDQILSEIRKNNCEGFEGKELVALEGWIAGETSRNNVENCDRHNQLKLKFLRDAFFYFMIDFHSDEQIKAILAVLAYGDQRENVIHQAYRMRQRGKKFTVKEVSSRELSFLHEEM